MRLMASAADRLVAWMQDELVREAGVGADDATNAVAACMERLRERIAQPNVANPNLVDHLRSAAADAVTAARATRRCPGGKRWWSDAGEDVRALLLAGRFTEALEAQAEALAGPSDIDVDFNWPDDKLFGLPLPEVSAEGDRVTLGDGEGNRMDATVVRRDGKLGIEADPHSSRNPTGDLWKEASYEAEQLVRTP